MSSSGINRSKVANPLAINGPNTTATFDVDTPSAGNMRLLAGATPILVWDGTAIQFAASYQIKPDSSGVRDLGSSTLSWRRVYAVNISLGLVSFTNPTYNATSVSPEFIIMNNAAGTANLPDPTGLSGSVFVVKNINAASLTVASLGVTKTIDGAATKTLAQWQFIQVVSDGTQWLIVG